jgi:putative transposase
MGCCRWTYNAALAHIKSGKEHQKTFYWLRNRFVNECNISAANGFLLDTPKHVREGAIKDLAQAYAINFKVRKRNPSHRFDIRFRKKRDTQSIVIPKDAFKQREDGVVLYPTMLSKDPLIDHVPSHDCRLTLDRGGRFVLHVPVDVDKFTPLRKTHREKVVSIDPGVRTFLTTWSPDGEAYKIGDGDSTKMYRLLLRTDKLISSVAHAKKRSKWRKNKKLQSLRQQIENFQRDLHYQSAKFLTSKYDDIILPVFGSKRMSSRADRKLRTKTVRSMLGMGHYAFRQRLKDVADRRGCRVFECTEEYTSKTCSCCGWLHPSLGGAKTFTCRECNARIDRDLQGAFNIFLKYAKEHPGFYPG